MEIGEKKKIKRERWALILSVLIALFTVNLLAARHFTRLDLTENKNYTLAEATKTILKNLEDVVTLRLYFTPDLPPALRSLRRDVDDILAEFKTYSENKIRVEYHNPQETPTDEQKTLMMGIPPIEVTVIEKDKQELAKIYLGMTVNFASKQEVLAVIQNISNLEYRLAAAVMKVTQKQEPVVGWWGPSLQPEQGEDPIVKGANYSLFRDRIERRFQIKQITGGTLDWLTPEEIPVLIFVVPENLEETEIAAFQNYLDQGGSAIVLASRSSVTMGQGLKPVIRQNPLEKLLKSYGVSIQEKLVLDQSNAMATFSGGYISYQMPYPYWVRIRPESFNKEEPMVSELTSLVLAWANPLQVSAPLPEGTESAVLFTTTPYGVMTPIPTAEPVDPQSARRALAGGRQRTIPLAVKILRENKEKPMTQLLVLGNSAFLQNNFMQQFEENGIFLENAIDVFSTGESLVGIRSKGVVRKPIAITSESMRTWIKLLDISVAPFILIGLGIGIYFWRRSRAKQLRLFYNARAGEAPDSLYCGI